MKKILALMLLAALCLGLCGCGSFVSLLPGAELEEQAAEEALSEAFEPEALFDFLGMETFAQSYYDNTPVAVSYAEGSGGLSPRYDREAVIQACDALRGVTVTAEKEEYAEADRRFVFTMADGSTHTIRFAGRDLSSFTGDYSLQGGEALWEIAFPGYGGDFDLFDLYTDGKMRSFADEFESNTPVSVGRRVNGGALLTSTDADVVRRAFEILRDAAVERVEGSVDQNVNLNHQEEYIFTLADGKTVTFLFTGSCLTVKNSEVYGPVYYWLGGVEELLSMEILPEDTGEDFAGGAVTGLREDIREAADCANGNVDGKTVIGVYVSYVIDGQEGIVTFQNEAAAEFMQYLADLQVTGEKSETPPEGEEITVSVTLSDWSGPILNFTGDVIQETIGTWYRCDEASFDALQQHILDAASSQTVAEEEESEE